MSTPRPTLTVADACSVIGEAGFGAAPPGVGFELEWFVIRDGAPVVDRTEIRDAIESGGALPHNSSITFEPGGQVEVSTPPAPDGPTAIAHADADALAVRARLAQAGMELVALGLDAGAPRARVLDEPRYSAMADYFAQLGSAGATMMCGTASLQVNVGFDDDVDAHWEYAHDLALVLGAMFAHSPLVEGRPSGWQSSRLAVWAALDPMRTGPVDTAPGARNAWVRYALDAPVMLIHHDRACTVPSPGLTLREWVERGYRGEFPDPADIGYHLTTLFPPVRPRGWLEIRVLDALPEPWWRVAGAVTVTALSDPAVRAALAPRLRETRDRWLLAAWRGVHEPCLRTAADAVFTTTLPALVTAGYDAADVAAACEFAARYPERGRSLADDRLDEWHARGALVPQTERVPTPSR